ncbi:hypothetical protein [Corynebacterium sp. EPI-003-04-2554_SCH2473622]|uniref:hypothetical protein n=1 Tax=Corynebacterium sp. EPI-003-04-2554_SCH2473622 TaxID=1834153 RepID=UPI000A9677CF|nr:hypothetical protein [Corynebacterium sp. EPI-003-04-2554_SCH2473622]
MIDSGVYTHLAICPQCKWRIIHGTKAGAYMHLAKHFKDMHDDTAAAARARFYMRQNTQ